MHGTFLALVACISFLIFCLSRGACIRLATLIWKWHASRSLLLKLASEMHATSVLKLRARCMHLFLYFEYCSSYTTCLKTNTADLPVGARVADGGAISDARSAHPSSAAAVLHPGRLELIEAAVKDSGEEAFAIFRPSGRRSCQFCQEEVVCCAPGICAGITDCFNFGCK